MKKIIISFFALAAVFLVLNVPAAAALGLKDSFSNILSTVGGGAGYDTAQTKVEPIIGNIISVALSFLGIIFLVLMIYGGYMWMTAAGNEEKAKTASKLIIAAVIGLLVVVAAFAITTFVMRRLTVAAPNQFLIKQ